MITWYAKNKFQLDIEKAIEDQKNQENKLSPQLIKKQDQENQINFNFYIRHLINIIPYDSDALSKTVQNFVNYLFS